jgi:hypothetical protein
LPPARASGSVADASKVLERQHDIVLIDAAFGPTLLAGSAAGLFPVESVFGIIEAKSGPDLKLSTVANSLLEARGLSAAEGVARHGETIEPGKTGPGLHVVVAFKAPAPETTAARLEAANKNAAESQRLPIDLVLVLFVMVQPSMAATLSATPTPRPPTTTIRRRESRILPALSPFARGPIR